MKVPRKVWLCVLRQYFEAGLPRFRHQEEVSTNIIKSVLLSWLGTRHTTYASTCTVTWYSKLNYTLCHTRSWIYTSTLLIRISCKCIEHHRWAAGCGSSIQLWRTLHLIASSIYIGVSVWQTCSDGGYLEEALPVMELVPSTSWGLRPHAASLNFVQLWK